MLRSRKGGMEFSSIFFIWVFLPISLIAYYFSFKLPLKEKSHIKLLNGVLLVLSLVFYLRSGIKNLLLMIIMILLNYGAGLWIDCFSGEGEAFRKSRKGVFIASLILNVGILIFFKYFNMMVTLADILVTHWRNIPGLLFALVKFEGPGTVQFHQIAMPLAISYTTFQSISYLADVYKGRIKAESSFLDYSLFTCFFAQLVQGPIMRYQELGSQMGTRTHSPRQFSEGINRFCCGLGKKVLIGNTLAVTANKIWNKPAADLSTAEAWLGIVLFTMQLYYDFSGYADMAVGLGRMFGFKISENFNYPFTSHSVQEFWRRWHMTLSSWFRDYIYIPLGGNRKGSRRTYINIFIVFLLTGIWHGANLNYIIWGIFVAVSNLLERWFLGSLLRKNPIKPLNCIYSFFIFMMGLVLFRAPNLYHAAKYYTALFSGIPEKPGNEVLSYFNGELFIALIISVLCAGFLQRAFEPVRSRFGETVPFSLFRTAFSIAIFVLSLMFIMNGSYNPSIYAAF